MSDSVASVKPIWLPGSIDGEAGSLLGHRTKSSVRAVSAMGFGELGQAEQFKGGGGFEQVRGIVVQMHAIANADFR